MRAGLFLVLLAACTAVSDGPQPTPLRHPDAAFASQANASLARLSGSWVIVSGAGVQPGTRVTVGADRMTFGIRTDRVEEIGPGRLRVGDAEVWVHWLDTDNRTAALGMRDGSRVWIMDRTGRPGERLAAARDVLAWYGYDLAQLEGI